jgi:2',3'-cyclic-nucleotide 2'-phosphodiesterase (5'-nucleotidase family)
MLALAMLPLALGTFAKAKSPAPVHEFTILHFNDFHGQVQSLKVPPGQPCGGLARLAAQAGQIEARNRKAGEPTFLFFSGDLFTGTSFSTLFQGDPEFQALSLMHLTAMTTGNHEWDFGQGVLMARARKARFPVLLDNVTSADPDHVFWRPALDLKVGDLRVGVIGVTTADTPITTAPGNTQGYAFSDPVAAVGAILGERGQGWDFVVVLSHCGFEVDRAMAGRYPQLGLIVGAHDHKVLDQPFVENGVPIVQAGDRGRYLGEVRVQIVTGKRARVTGRLVPVTEETPPDKAVVDLLAPYLDKEESALGAVIGKLPVALSGDRNLLRSREAPIGDLLADAMRDEAKADIAFMNGGGIRAGLPAGEVTGRDLLACLPFFDSLATVKLTGAQVQALLDRCAAMPEQDAPGGFLQVSGLTVRYEGGKALDLKVGGAPVDPARDYLVACSHFLLSGGDGLSEFTEGRDVRDFGLALQELMRRQLVRSGLVIPEPGSRIVRAPAKAQGAS